MNAMNALIEVARERRRLVALTGAGISTESGIPDYRGPGGVWERRDPPTLSDFKTNPETRRLYWEQRRLNYPQLVAARPNEGHLALAAMERVGRLDMLITQNIDGLHQVAGNAPERVIELHGTAHRVRCLDCGRSWPASSIQARLDTEPVPPCEVCGGPLRVATILFGEPLPPDALARATDAARACDLMLAVGSSLVVNPAAQLPLLAQRGGAFFAIVNRTATALDRAADIVVRGEAGPTLQALAAAVAPG